MLIKIDRQIDHMEEQKRRLKVQELSFNSYYEFALERIPQITQLEKISFNIHDFAAILKQFYRGGELEMTLNSDLDINLFDERFIVFEIDKIKDDPVLFPIVVLIIMDVFLQKMRIKKGRKALIIEEAWLWHVSLVYDCSTFIPRVGNRTIEPVVPSTVAYGNVRY